MKNWDYMLKLIIIGDSSVGKSSLMLRYADAHFDISHKPTIGVDFKFHTIQFENKTIKLQIWDTAGQDRFQTITTSYYRGALGVFLVYDITNSESFQNITKWANEARKYADNDVQVFLIGNKSDMQYERAVSYSSGKALADMIGALFLETSAKESKNVEEAFIQMSKNIYKLVNKPATKSSQEPLNLKSNQAVRSSTCNC